MATSKSRPSRHPPTTAIRSSWDPGTEKYTILEAQHLGSFIRVELHVVACATYIEPVLTGGTRDRTLGWINVIKSKSAGFCVRVISARVDCYKQVLRRCLSPRPGSLFRPCRSFSLSTPCLGQTVYAFLSLSVLHYSRLNCRCAPLLNSFPDRVYTLLTPSLALCMP